MEFWKTLNPKGARKGGRGEGKHTEHTVMHGRLTSSVLVLLLNIKELNTPIKGYFVKMSFF